MIPGQVIAGLSDVRGMTVPTFVAAAAGNASTGTTTVTLSTHQKGDFLLVFGSVCSDITPPSGWTKIAYQAGTGQDGIAAYYRFATSAAETNPVFPDSGDHNYLTCLTFRGVYIDPIDAYSTGNAASGVTFSYPDLTTKTPNTLVCQMVIHNDFGNTGNYANANLTLTSRFTGETGVGGISAIAIATAPKVQPGAIGVTTAAIIDDGSAGHAFLNVALKS